MFVIIIHVCILIFCVIIYLHNLEKEKEKLIMCPCVTFMHFHLCVKAKKLGLAHFLIFFVLPCLQPINSFTVLVFGIHLLSCLVH